MSAGNGTPWGSAAGEEAWAASGVAVEGSELPTFSAAAKVRVGVTIVLFVSSAGGNLAVLWSVTRPQPSQLRPSPVRTLFAHLAAADLLVTFVVMPLDATWNITVQWLAGDIACRTLMFLKLMAMYSAAFLPVVIGLDRQAAVLNPFGSRSGCMVKWNLEENTWTTEDLSATSPVWTSAASSASSPLAFWWTPNKTPVNADGLSHQILAIESLHSSLGLLVCFILN